MRFIPIDVNSPQDVLAKRLALLLCLNGIHDTGALPLAIEILSGLQRALDADSVRAAVDEWDRNDARWDEHKAKYLYKAQPNTA